MERKEEDILRRLEAAIAEWNAQVTDAHLDLTEQIVKAKERIDASIEPKATQKGENMDWSQVRDEFDGFRKLLNQTIEVVGVAAQQIAKLESGVAALQREVQSLRSQPATGTQDMSGMLAGLRAELSSMRDQLTEAKAVGAKVDELKGLLRSERARVEVIGKLAASVGGDNAQGVLAQELAEALRDLDEAREEIVSLRSDMDALRKGAAPRPAPARPKMKVSIEAFDSEGSRRRLGEILVDAGIITRAQLESALAEQGSAYHKQLGHILIEKGFTGEDVIAQVVASQLQVPFIDLDEEDIDPAAARMISGRVASARKCIPLRTTPEALLVAMANPLDLIAIEDVELVTGRMVEPAVATSSDIMAAIDRVYQS
ncbi:MAG: hypothetical protein HY706_20615 [Candidatus Hydrogenedentes bacterium]|nr:hypothetical protein [Candidatus Hydrogenedentota bacterium]